MRIDPKENIVLEVALKSCPEYLSRIRTIAACLADSAGLDRRESNDAAIALTEACANEMSQENDRMTVVFDVSQDSFSAQITDLGTAPANTPKDGTRVRLMRKLDVALLESTDALAIKPTKSARRLRTLVNCGAELAI